VVERLRRRLRADEGFGLIELLMALTMLNIGILAIAAGFQSAALAVTRAGRTATASTVADRQVELFRGIPYGCIYENSPPSDSTYTGDSAYDATFGITSGTGCSSAPPSATATTTEADHHQYRTDTYVAWTCPGANPTGSASNPSCPSSSTGRPLKKVTVVVRDTAPPNVGRVLVRESSTFDAAYG
jgi:Tfp pilus assembly protein PilV